MQATGLNRRIHPRSLTDERADLLDGDQTHRCVVRDRSQGGARLVFRQAVSLSQLAVLVARGTTRSIEVIWSDGRQAGVRFVD